ncbi:MAG: hypothetical protein AAB152_18520 [Candidatus Coatesbacteria bacterium]
MKTDTLGDYAFLTPEDRLRRITEILAKGVLRVVERQRQEAAQDRAFGDALAAEIAALPGGAG